jgi:hypothetical protein
MQTVIDHNIQLPGDVYTIRPDWVSEKLRWRVQIVTDLAGGSLGFSSVFSIWLAAGQYGSSSHCTVRSGAPGGRAASQPVCLEALD